MNILVDTSAFIAMLYAEDDHHKAASQCWISIVNEDNNLLTTNYILIEALAVLQHRFGLQAVRTFNDAILPILSIQWITPEIHNLSLAVLLASNRRQLSLVDCCSFEIMRSMGIEAAFAFDAHFAEQGFTCLPAG